MGNRKKGKSNVIASSKFDAKPKAENIDLSYSKKKIVLDLSFPYLFYFISYSDFTNKFKTPYDYIDYSKYLYQTLFKKLSETTIDDLGNINEWKHSHTLEDVKSKKVENIIKSIVLNENGDYKSAKEFVNQNIKDVSLWQVGLSNRYGRVFGYFTQNIFKPILLDPYHLIYKDKNGHVGRHNDINTFKFFPNKMDTFVYSHNCLKCGKESDNLSVFEDDILKINFYICDECILKIIENQM